MAPRHPAGAERAARLTRLVMSAGLTGLIGVFAAATGRAESLTLSYLVAWGHVTLVEVEVSVRQTGSRYHLVGGGRTTGVLDLLFPWHGRAETQGVVTAGTRRPLVHQHEGTWKGNTRWTRVSWDGAALPRAEARPPVDPAKVTPVRARSTQGTSDPLSVMMSVLDRLAETGRCEGEAKIWDGRRRYNVSVTHLGAETLVADRPWTYEGGAVGCALDFERIGGFWRENPGRQNAGDRTPDRRVIWVAETSPDRWVLVRAEVETRYGTVVGRLLYDEAASPDEARTPLAAE